MKAALPVEDYEIIETMAKAIEALSRIVDEKAASVKRLLKRVFGSKSERRSDWAK